MQRDNGLITTGLDETSSAQRLPVWRLLAFTMAGFITIMTETMPAGLLPLIGQGLGVSQAMAGQLITLYALFGAAARFRRCCYAKWRRRPLFLMAIGGLLVFNTVTALSSHYVLTLVARFIAGMAAGVIWGLLVGYARRMVPHDLQGRALAVVGIGQPVALCLGVPLGTWLGALFDWRGVFWIMSALALLLFVWVRFGVPDYAGQTERQRQPIRSILLTPGLRSILFVIFVWIFAHNILYTYIAPFLVSVGLGQRIDLVLLLFGVASIVGIAVTGMWVDRGLRALTLLSLAVFAMAALVLGMASTSPGLVLLSIAIWGLTFGGAPTLLQTAIADTAGDGADVAQSMLVTIFNLAVAAGGIVGGLLLEKEGPGSFPPTLLVLALLGLVVVWQAREVGFKSGHRAILQ